MNFTSVILGILAFCFVLVAHEVGHIVAGYFVQFRFSFFALGPILINRSEHGRLRILWNKVLSLYGGAAMTIPTGTKNLRRRFAVVIAGGPCANLLLALVVSAPLMLSVQLSSTMRSELGWVRLLSTAIFCGTAIPLKNGPFLTDGLRLLRLLGTSLLATRETSILTLVSLQMSGVRPSQWDKRLIDNGLILVDGSIFECEMRMYAYYRALDVGDVSEAGTQIDRLMELVDSIPRGLRGEYYIESAYYEAWHRRRTQVALQHFAEVPERGFNFQVSDRLRAHAAISIVNGDHEQAVSDITLALAKLPIWATWSRARLLELSNLKDFRAL